MKNYRVLATFTLNLTLSLMGLAATSSVLPAQDTAISRAELGRFDSFLDNHPDIAQELTKNPSLVNDIKYAESHPALQAFLEDHAQIRESLQANPQAFMKGVASVDAVEEARSDLGHRGQLVTLDNFLDNHPGLAKQLSANPSLVNSQAFMKANPDLVTFLNSHPGIASDFIPNPSMVMNAVAKFDKVEVRSEVKTLDNFLDAHPSIATQLEANPSLVNSQTFLKANPDLVTFLNNHPELVGDFMANPTMVMNSVAQFDNAEVRSEVRTLDNFLDNHPALAKQLEANPSLVNSQSFMKAHPDLVAFLKDHPELGQDLLANPMTVMSDLTKFDTVESERSKGEAAQVEAFDNFLDNHPAVAAQVEAHPSLASNADFIDAHPELKTFLENHPGVLEALQGNSHAFMNQVQHFDRHEAKIEQHEALNHK